MGVSLAAGMKSRNDLLRLFSSGGNLVIRTTPQINANGGSAMAGNLYPRDVIDIEPRLYRLLGAGQDSFSVCDMQQFVET
jgi:hypothetical protein